MERLHWAPKNPAEAVRESCFGESHPPRRFSVPKTSSWFRFFFVLRFYERLRWRYSLASIVRNAALFRHDQPSTDNAHGHLSRLLRGGYSERKAPQGEQGVRPLQVPETKM